MSLSERPDINSSKSEIKGRLENDPITYNEISCVLANTKGKHRKKSIHYFIGWYQHTNCLRKCYSNKKQRQECRTKFQQLAAKIPEEQFTKKEFLPSFHNRTDICALPAEEKKRFMPCKEFKKASHKTSL